MSITQETRALPPHATHEVENQVPPLARWNVFARDRALVEALRREGADWAEERTSAFGDIIGRPETVAQGALANENRPVLRTHDRSGRRIDEVDFHPGMPSSGSAWRMASTPSPGASRGRGRTWRGRRCS